MLENRVVEYVEHDRHDRFLDCSSVTDQRF